MSLEFNRRSFLKYTAVAAVAVAGSSLLTGCGDEKVTERDGLGSITNIQVTASVNSGATYDVAKGLITIPMTIETKRDYPVDIDTAHFAVSVLDSSGNSLLFYNRSDRHLQLDGINEDNMQLKKKDSVTFKLVVEDTVSNITAAFAQAKTVNVYYTPDTGYSKYVGLWHLTVGSHINAASGSAEEQE